MQAGNMGGGDRGGGKKPPGRDKLRFSVCDVSSDDFKKTWLTLKELHDKELHRLQAKLASLRKERLADGRWTGSITKIKELTEQQKVLSSTIHDLRDQLNAKVCDRCTLNESYRNTLQQEFYDIQQQNLHFIAELTEERNRLREENKKLSARLNQQRFHPSFSDSDDEDFVPCTQRSVPVFSVKEPSPGTPVHLPSRLIKQSQTTSGQKERRRSPKFSIPFYSQDLFEEPETSSQKISSNSAKPNTESSAHQKSPGGFPVTSTLGPQSGHGFQDVSNLPEDKLGQPKRKQIFTQKTSTQKTSSQKCETQMDFSWSLSSISNTENPTTQVISETSEDNMPDYNGSSFPPFTQSKEKPPVTVFPFDYTLKASGRRRSKSGVAKYNIGFSVRDCTQTPSTGRSTVKNANKPTGTGYDADKPQGDTQSSISGSAIKRKARIQPGRGGK